MKQIHPRFAGYIISKLQIPHSLHTVLTYLPPIQRPITEFGTIIEMFTVSRELRMQSNMKYTHITLDVGAAIKDFQVVWNNPQAWSDIIIHLGDFHAMMAFFGIIGTYIKGSGFEEIIFQLGLSTSGSVKKVLKGKHCNQCWTIHEAFSEALWRLFMDSYVQQEMPEI